MVYFSFQVRRGFPPNTGIANFKNSTRNPIRNQPLDSQRVNFRQMTVAAGLIFLATQRPQDQLINREPKAGLSLRKQRPKGSATNAENAKGIRIGYCNCTLHSFANDPLPTVHERIRQNYFVEATSSSLSRTQKTRRGRRIYDISIGIFAE